MDIINGTFDTKYGRLLYEFRAEFRQMNETAFKPRFIMCFQKMIIVFSEQTAKKGWLLIEETSFKEQLQFACAIAIDSNSVLTKDVTSKVKVNR